MLRKIVWFILVLASNAEAFQRNFNNPEDSCYDENRENINSCPSGEQCQCVESKVFEIYSRRYKGDQQKGSGRSCEQRVRRDFMSLSKDERRRYINAILTLASDPRYKKKYFDLLQTHVDLFCKAIHCRVFFLAWHRWFILQYENLLREVDSNLTIAYWDWSMVMGSPWNINLWDDNEYSLGGNGNPDKNHTVDSGPFKQPEWQMVPGDRPDSGLKLTRYFNYTNPGIPSALHLAILFKYKPNDFKKFLTVYEAWHNNVHCAGFGWKSVMCNIDSAWSPEFFLHHGYIDKYWSEWQEQGESYKYSEYFAKQTLYMQGTYHLPKDVLDLNNQPGGVCVTYEESPNDWIHKKLRSLTLDQLRDIRGLQIIKMVEPPTDDQSKAFIRSNRMFIKNRRFVDLKNFDYIIGTRREHLYQFLERSNSKGYDTVMHNFIKNRGLRYPVALDELRGTDQIRGFCLHDLIKKSAQNVDPD